MQMGVGWDHCEFHEDAFCLADNTCAPLPPDPKWIQLPDVSEYGVDIQLGPDATSTRVIADNFECTEASLITGVHLWGSQKYDAPPGLIIDAIHLSIHANDPVGPGGSDPANLFDQPDQAVLWSHDCPPGAFTVWPYAVIDPGGWWWDPVTGELIPDVSRQVYQIDIAIAPAEAFRQRGSPDGPRTYWLAVRLATIWEDFGWKSRRWLHDLNPDAVWDMGSELPRLWKELRYPPGHPYHGLERDSIDMAFALTSDSCPIAPRPTAAEDWWSTTQRLTGSDTCTSDEDCPNLSLCIDDICYFTYNRFLYVNLVNAGQSVAYRIKDRQTGATTWLDGYGIEQVVHNNLRPDLLTYVKTTDHPVYRSVWPSDPVGITGCFIAPGRTYDVQAILEVCDPAVENYYSDPLTLVTSKYGDLVQQVTPPGPQQHLTPPQGVVHLATDTLTVLAGFANLPYTSKLYCDLIGAMDPSDNDVNVTILDVLDDLNAFIGGAYTGVSPDQCPSALPSVVYTNSGCLDESAGPPESLWEPCAEDDRIELIPGVDTLRVVHWDATYNCCQDEIRVTLSIDGSMLRLAEEEVPPGGMCYCICCFNVETTILQLRPGEYTVEYCWLDYEHGERCDGGTVVIPGGTLQLGGGAFAGPR